MPSLIREAIMQRRAFIAGVAAATAWSSLGRAQQTVPVVGFLNVASAAGYSNYVAAFRDGLRESGYVDGQSVAIEYRWAEGHYERLPDMAADLVRRQVSVITANTPANLIAKAATDTIPIVFTTAGDPVQLGLVASLSRPGGNVTGVSQLNVEVMPKRLEVAHELMPGATEVGLLLNPTDPVRAAALLKETENAAGPLGLRLACASRRNRDGDRCRHRRVQPIECRRAGDRCRCDVQQQQRTARQDRFAPPGPDNLSVQ